MLETIRRTVSEPLRMLRVLVAAEKQMTFEPLVPNVGTGRRGRRGELATDGKPDWSGAYVGGSQVWGLCQIRLPAQESG